MAFGWLVLGLVFLDELLVVAAVVTWGVHVQGWPLGTVLGFAVVAVWWAFASPKAPLSSPVIRPIVKALVFGIASAALWATGRHELAVALLGFSAIINAIAQLPAIRALTDPHGQPYG